jgi:hypothetical protein
MQTAKLANVTDADDLEDAIRDFVNENSRWEDVGIGSYEFWGARGNDVRWVRELEDDTMSIRINDYSDDMLPYSVKVNVSGGGCDGEHGGRCNGNCAEWEMGVTALLLEVKTNVEYTLNEHGTKIRNETKIATYSLEVD